MLTTLAVSNYRSLRDVVLPLARLTVIAGPNGSGKSSLYRSLRLLAECAQGRLVASLASEGGLPSTLWAGPETITKAMRTGRHPVQGTVRREAVHLRLGFASDDFGYAIDLGLPSQKPAAFALDPEVKRECIWAGPVFRPAALLIDRRGPHLRATDSDGVWQSIPGSLSGFGSMMTEFADPRSAPEMAMLRERLRSWRFYDHLRSDPGAPARQPQVGTYTPVLSDDGANLAAAIQTIREIGDGEALDAAIDDAFPDGSVEIVQAEGRFEVAMRQPGLLRALRAPELSDGTLRYLMLVAALLTPRPPELLVLNEPETSLHPDLVPALARLISAASAVTQAIVVTHDAVLIDRLADAPESRVYTLAKSLGETGIVELDERPRWEWPPR